MQGKAFFRPRDSSRVSGLRREHERYNSKTDFAGGGDRARVHSGAHADLVGRYYVLPNEMSGHARHIDVQQGIDGGAGARAGSTAPRAQRTAGGDDLCDDAQHRVGTDSGCERRRRDHVVVGRPRGGQGSDRREDAGRPVIDQPVSELLFRR